MIHCDICDRSKSISISRHQLSIEVFFTAVECAGSTERTWKKEGIDSCNAAPEAAMR